MLAALQAMLAAGAEGDEPGVRVEGRPPPDCLLVVTDTLGRAPGPRVVDCLEVVADPSSPVRSAEQMQAVVDAWSTLVADVMIPAARGQVRTPVNFLMSEALSHVGHDSSSVRQLSEQIPRGKRGVGDAIVALWVSSADRMLILSVTAHDQDPPFCEEERRAVNLMLRATAPLADGGMFVKEPSPSRSGKLGPLTEAAAAALAGEALTTRQEEVLVLLLTGASEKEAAARLGVSQHTVHSYIKQLYSLFRVSSRGELLALFIDRRVLQLHSGQPTPAPPGESAKK